MTLTCHKDRRRIYYNQSLSCAYLDVANFSPGYADGSSGIHDILYHLLANPNLWHEQQRQEPILD